jgi:hypothetical protein
MSESLDSLLKLKVPEIFLDDIRHRHAQCRGEVLPRHRPLFFKILKQLDQAVCKALCISRRIKLDRQFLALRHLSEVSQICAHDGYTISTSQMRNPTATCR